VHSQAWCPQAGAATALCSHPLSSRASTASSSDPTSENYRRHIRNRIDK
jgi:hypothetical protein